MNSDVQKFIENLKIWKKEFTLLRQIMLDCGLAEEYKWKHPCYTWNGKNILILGNFKEYCALMLFKGALLKDKNNILIQPTENSHTTRQMRFTHVDEIQIKKSIITEYVREAIQIEKLGLKLQIKTASDYEVPEELLQHFKANPNLKKLFYNLTPGRQKAYLLHFSQAKQSKTRLLRIKRNLDRILSGKGLDDCICGLSKRMPSCDGSHKFLNTSS